MFQKILIANRGEIACRIIKTCRRLDIQTVAVFSEADRDALHVKLADEAVWIGEANPAGSYLEQDKILEAAQKQEAQAIHPGYGFLSENAAFAQRCGNAGIIFIGPSVKALEMMGSKSISKDLMEQNGVPTVPGYHGEDQTIDNLVSQAQRIGFPLLIKASAGGGGKGMRIIEREENLQETLMAARREVTNSFGDPRLLLEKYLPSPRHVEVQIFGDITGEIFHLFERDCSIQRRYQKIIEEAPALNLDNGLQDKLYQAAITAAQAVDYKGAGTVEFLVNGDNFYFMEMNTRLQVEHPVTEMITGIDLVEWQLIVASGHSIDITQNQIQKKGHAVEVRLCAENPFNNFMPTIGILTKFEFNIPEALAPHLRIDSGATTDTSISIFYDSLIAKIIAWGETRDQAVSRLLSFIGHSTIHGIETNLEYITRILTSSAFKNGEITTNFIPKYQEELLSSYVPPQVLAIAACTVSRLREQDNSIAKTGHYNWRLNMDHTQTFEFYYHDTLYNCDLTFRDDFIQAAVGKDHFKIRLVDSEHIRIEDKSIPLPQMGINEEINIFYNQVLYHVFYKDRLRCALASQNPSGDLGAHMPGKITNVVVSVGQQVKAGDSLIMMEAMKMEHVIKAPFDAKVISVPFAKGEMVQEGQELVKLEKAE